MQPPIFSIIRQWFVACINDSAVELHPLIDVVHDMIGALAKLEIDLCLLLRRLEIKRQRIGLTDSTGASKDLPGRQKSKQRPKNWRRELRLALHQIILVTTKRGARVVIEIIFDKRDAILRAKGNQRRLEQVVSCQFISHQIVQMETFWRRVLDVSHIKIQTPTVTKKTSVTRWLFIVAIMQINRAGFCVSEKMIFNLRRPEFRITVRLFLAQKTAIFGFDSDDPVH